MPVVKGGVWTNIEDEILKASVSKYGLNQWARVSSLLARKTAKQCKARWSEWLDPGIRKIEWSKEEDEKLLHLAKLMPTQWRTIAERVGRTATQCLERYQKLLDDAESRDSELGLGGPEGGESLAPTGDDVRRLRPGELDPDPESKPARPDTIDLDEDEKEMLSEARARLANTQGKKAKRKARERQLEESRRLAMLQKRRELKTAGINLKITNKKKGQMDYNADIPFEKQATSGFYDTLDEQAKNEREREMFDPRKQQLARKRQGDTDDQGDSKRQKPDSDKNKSAGALAASIKAGQMQKMREAEQQSRRRALNLPAPQVSESELEDIIKMGMAGDRAAKAAGESGDQGLISRYSSMASATPLRTPMAPPQEDHIANEIRNIRALTETQSSLLGGENTPLHEGRASTGFDGANPRKSNMVTPNPMATPRQQPMANGHVGPGSTPIGTPRDSFAINNADRGQLGSQTPRDIRLGEAAAKQSLRQQLSSLPRPKETDWELEELPFENAVVDASASTSREDQEEIDRREAEAREAAAKVELQRQTQVYQRSLPRPATVDLKQLSQLASTISEPILRSIAIEAAILASHDSTYHPLSNNTITSSKRRKASGYQEISDEYIALARAELAREISAPDLQTFTQDFETHAQIAEAATDLPLHLSSPSLTAQALLATYTTAHTSLLTTAQESNALEKKLAVLFGGYQARAKTLRKEIEDASETLAKKKAELDAFRTLAVHEEGAVGMRLEKLREEVAVVMRREREGQEEYRELLGRVGGEGKGGRVNGVK